MLAVVPGPASDDNDCPATSNASLIDQMVREGRTPTVGREALQAEVGAAIAAFADKRDEHGHRLFVRNGCHRPREVLTRAGSVAVTAPASHRQARRP
ncbi:hypothetical protein [Amycolatopsis sp. NPDC051372]|uniref:hypothetical protein n=1 Tax=Amycolatopsis sp. NPDC051372 TaxID=3155669 RepID=UPI003431D0E5